MATITLRNGRRVGDFQRPYVISELNTSHFGDIEIAREMIRQVKAAGGDCVKFQSWSAETLYAESYYKANAIVKRVVKKFSLSSEQLRDLSQYAGGLGIDFASTPYSIEEARFLVEQCNVPFVKIASMELNNIPYLTELGKLGVPLILSTGMGVLDEIIEAVNAIKGTDNDQLILLHCTSIYPAPPDIIRLQNILGLRSEFPNYPIGYSDHSLGIEIPAASIALGACVVEKHFTLDSSRIGMDNQMASEPEELAAMIKACHRVYDAMGGSGRILSSLEKSQAIKMRRSIVAKNDLLKGHLLTQADFEFKRPGNGLSPMQCTNYIGRTVVRKIEAGSVLFADDFA